MGEVDEARPITDDDLNTGLQALLNGPLPGSLRPHPATGWMSVIRVAGSKILPPQSQQQSEPQMIQMGPIQMQAMPIPVEEQVGIVAAKVIEVGKFPGNPDEESKSPFEWGPGDTIYMASDRGIEIGDFVLVMIDKVICFTKADED